MGTNVIVGGILSFPDVLIAIPRSKENSQDLIFKISVLIRKGDPQIEKIQSIIEQERDDGLETPCFKDGATDSYFSKDSIHHDFMIFSCSCTSDRRPVVVDQSMKPIIDRSKIIAGMEGSVYANIHSYALGRKGVRAGLEGVQVTNSKIVMELVAPQKTAQQMFGQIAPAATSQPVKQMTALAQSSYEEYTNAGWTDQQLIDGGLLKVPLFIEIAPAATSQPVKQMTALAQSSYEEYTNAGWTDQQLIESGFLKSSSTPTTPYAWK